MSELKSIENMAQLIETARKLGPMTDAERREQAASFAFGNLALTSAWCDKPAPELEKLRDMCRRAAGCIEPLPIPLVLHCPSCSFRHLDEGNFATKPHHTHSCQECGMTWRPAVVHTVGVRFLPGFKSDIKDSPELYALKKAAVKLAEAAESEKAEDDRAHSEAECDLWAAGIIYGKAVLTRKEEP